MIHLAIIVSSQKFTSNSIINSRLKNITIFWTAIEGDVVKFWTSNIQVQSFKSFYNSFCSYVVITGGLNIISDSFLSGNTANELARLIYFEPLLTYDTNKKNRLGLTNFCSSFKSSDTDKEIFHIVIKHSFLNLNNLILNLDNAKSTDIPVINIRMKRCGANVKKNVKIECPSITQIQLKTD